MDDLAPALRERRRALGMTQRQLADICGVSERFVVEVEAGRDTAGIGRVLRLVARLGLDLRLSQRGA